MSKTARIWGYVRESPPDRPTMHKEQNRVPAALTDEELERLLAHCPEPTRTVVALAADTGMRRSELGRLTWGDVDFEAGTLTVRRSKNRDHRPDDPPGPEPARCASRGGERNGEGAADGGYLTAFGTSGTESRFGHVHLHMPRHTTATRLRDRGVPLDRIMEILGHRSYSMVLRYAKARPQQLIEAMRALDGERVQAQPEGSSPLRVPSGGR